MRVRCERLVREAPLPWSEDRAVEGIQREAAAIRCPPAPPGADLRRRIRGEPGYWRRTPRDGRVDAPAVISACRVLVRPDGPAYSGAVHRLDGVLLLLHV